jgi:GNAT superfamily N-acetyltransferase
MPPETYYHWHHQIIETLMCDGLCAWVLAHAPEDPRFIYGWMCGQMSVRADDGISPIVHYTYVKKPFRRLGVATALLELFGVNSEVALIATHRTPAGDQVLAGMKAVALYNPYLAWARLPSMPVQIQNLAGQRTQVRKRVFARSRRELGKGAAGDFVPTPRKAP